MRDFIADAARLFLWFRSTASCGRRVRKAVAPLTQTLEQYEQRGDEHDPHDGRHQHTAEHRGANDATALAPAPVASIIGMTPIINDTAVIITARKRRDAPSLAASTIVIPSMRRARANSTIRIAFLAASAISNTRPICT